MKHGKLVVGLTNGLQEEILQLWHQYPTGGHSGINNTYRRGLSLFYWKNLKEDVIVFVKNCSICQKNKYDTFAHSSLLHPLKISSTAWSHISMNFIEGLPKSLGKTVVWVVMDKLTKYGHSQLCHIQTQLMMLLSCLSSIFLNYMECPKTFSMIGTLCSLVNCGRSYFLFKGDTEHLHCVPPSV